MKATKEGLQMQPQDSTNGLKRCTGCGEEKPVEEFHRHKGNRDGRCYRCKTCTKAGIVPAQRILVGQQNLPGFKRCSYCGKTRALDGFYHASGPKGGYKDGRDYTCKVCLAKKAKRGSRKRKKKQHIHVEEKLCRICGETKHRSAFYTNRNYADWLESRCIQCTKEHNKKTHNNDYQRRRHLWRVYGLTEDALKSMLAAQGGRCAICEREIFIEIKYNRPERLNVDHCHVTRRIRGLLCRECNFLLGAIERPGFLDKALAYLGKHKQ